MLRRFAASLLALALLAPAAAADFAQPPADRVAVSRAPSRDAVRAALAARRAHNLASFRAYRKAGVYPHNYVRTGPLNVWLDPQGHLCAAATMIDKDGLHDLVMETAKTNNYLRLLDVTKGPLLDWVLTSGFTIEEIDRIQAPMIIPPEVQRRQDRDWRIGEDARLRRDYAATETWLLRRAKRGLDEAVDRLMEHPELAQRLVDAPVS